MKSANPERNFALQQAFLEQFVSLPFDDLAAIGTLMKKCCRGRYTANIRPLAKVVAEVLWGLKLGDRSRLNFPILNLQPLNPPKLSCIMCHQR